MQNKIKKIFANSSKKTCSKVLALMLVLTFSMSFVMPMAVFAADPISISADKATAFAGDTINITVVDSTLADPAVPTDVKVSGAGFVGPTIGLVAQNGEYVGTFDVPAGLTAGEDLTFTYTDSTATPADHSITVKVMQTVALQSATAMGSGATTIGTGDNIQLVFDEAIQFDAVPAPLGKDEVNNMLSDSVVNELTGIDYIGEWSESVPAAGYDIFTITFTGNGNATLQNGDSISLKAGLKVGHNSGYEITGTKLLTGVFGTVITPEITSIVAVSKHGSGISEQGDMIKVVYNTLVNHPAGNVTVTNGDLGAGATYEWDPATGTTILTITLGANPNVVIGTTKLNIAGVVDAGTNSVPCAQSTNLDITGSFGTPITPEVLSATAISTTGKGVASKGDMIKVVFNTVVTDLGAVVSVVGGSLGTGETYNWDSSTGSTILTITLGENPNVIPGTTTLDITGVKDAATKSVDCIKNTGIAIGGSFGSAIKPQVLSVTAVSITGNGTASAGDEIRVVFNTLVKSTGLINISSPNGFLGNNFTYAWAEENGTSVLKVVLGNNPNITPGTTTISISGDIKDAASNTQSFDSATIIIKGSFGSAIKPQVLSVTAVSTTGNGTASAGDEIRVVFNTLVKSTGLINISSPNGFLGNNFTYAWAEENGTSVLKVVLGNNPNITPGTTTISISGDIKDAASNTQSFDSATIIIKGSFGSVAVPQVVKVLAVSTTGKGAASKGDIIKVIFNTLVDSTGVTGVRVTNGNLGTLYDEYWRTENGVSVLVITLGENPQIKVGTAADATKLSIEGVIKDDATKTKICTNMTDRTISGSFGTGIKPSVVRVTAISTTGTGVAAASDIIKVVFNTLVDYSGVTGITLSDGGTLGTGFKTSWAPENGVSVLTITLGTNPVVTVEQTKLSIDGVITDELTNTLICDDAVNRIIGGSFGAVIIPHITSVTAISATGIGQAMAGDKIKVVFNTVVDHSGVTSVITNGSFGTGNSVDWFTENGTSIMIITLGENPVIKVGETKLSVVGAITDDLTKSAACDNATDIVIDKGSFGVATIPSVTSAVAYTDAASADLKGEYIRILFNAATNKPAINPVSIKVNNVTNVMGTGASAEWKSDFELLVALGADSTVKKGDTLDLSGLGIKAKDTTYFDIVKSTAQITGELAVPVVLTVIAADGNPSTQGAAKGDTITITFSSRTNKAANLTNLTALLGTGATATWNANGTVLTLTLGNNPTVYDGGFIVLNSIGIKDAFSDSHSIVGQYQITGFFGPVKEGPKVVKVSASSTDTSKTTIGNGDKVTIKFNAPTNQFGTKTKADLDQIIKLSAGKSLGTNYTGEWFNNDTLVITIVDSTGANIVPGVDKMSIGGTGEYAIKYASGLYDGSLATNESDVLITGSFDGRAFVIANVLFNKETGKVTATIDKSDLNYNGYVTVVFALYDGSTPVLINSVKMNIETKVDLESVFAKSNGSIVKIFIYSDFVPDLNTSPAVLANTVTKQ